ncbi:MAG: DUF1461 domain-containing protein [Caldisericaceae bacterium]
MKKVASVIAMLLIILLLPLYFILLLNRPIFAVLYNLLKLGELSNLGITSYLETVNTIVKYFFNFQKYLSLQDLTKIEIYHMFDVKNLFLLGLLVLVVSFVVFLLFRNSLDITTRKKIVFTFFIGISVVSFFGLLNFDLLFTLFHKMLFRNNYWLLDPNTLLIKLFPEQVFMSLGILWIILSLLFSVLLMII